MRCLLSSGTILGMNVKRLVVGLLVMVMAFGLTFAYGSSLISAQEKATSGLKNEKAALNKTQIKLEKDVSSEGPSLGKLVGGETDEAAESSSEKEPSGGVVKFTLQSLTNSILGPDDAGLAYGGSAVGTLASLIGGMYANPPASTHTYVADLLDSAHVVQLAQAQGLGFSALSPILETWKVFRNLAYLFFILLFLTIGFAIMFRRKLGGQTAITAQQAIPRIIMALVFVTFSYAIAGFLIDLMYIFMFLLLVVFEKLGNQTEFIGSNFLQLGWLMIKTGFN